MIRSSSLSGLFNRQISELYTPLMSRSFNMMLRAGDFGVIPGSPEEEDRIAAGKPVEAFPQEVINRLEAEEEVYSIQYKTKAANASRAEEYLAIIDVLSFSLQAVQVDETVRHRVNMHEGIKELSQIRGVPVGIIRQDDEVEEILAAENKQNQQAQLLQAAESVSSSAKNLASAEAQVKTAGV